MKFVMSYSCGKDSALSLWRMQEADHVCVALLVMYNSTQHRSFFHGVEADLLQEIADALAIPLLLCPSEGEDYHTAFEHGLQKAKAMGAQACVFGDIDIVEHRVWGEERCRHSGIEAVYPLWQENREALVVEGIQSGLQSIVKCIHNDTLPEAMLGNIVDIEMMEAMKQCNIDVCGENGEYHSICVAGPIFQRVPQYQMFAIHRFDTLSVIDIRRKTC